MNDLQKKIDKLQCRLVMLSNERRELADEMATIDKELQALSPTPKFESRAFRTEVTKTMIKELTEIKLDLVK